MASKDAITLDVNGVKVRLSSPEKPYFPALRLTKRDVAEYALAVGPGLLAALKDRPTTMERWPNGLADGASLVSDDNPDGDAFYQKRAPKNLPEFVQTGRIRFPSGRPADYVAPGNLATILWMINLGTLRFHAWPVRLPDTEAVDQLRIDLDPQSGTDFSDAVVVAKELRPILESVGLTPFVKTSGGRGLHVFCAIEPCDFIDARHAAIAAGRALAREMPHRVTVSWWKEERGKRVFVDFNQMARDRLMASAYSIRPTPEARVSMPLDWDEIETVHPDDFTVVTAPQRFAERGDAWAEQMAAPGSVGPLVAWYERDADHGEGEMPYPPEYPKMPGEPPRVQPSRQR